jgi:hypothetical protein
LPPTPTYYYQIGLNKPITVQQAYIPPSQKDFLERHILKKREEARRHHEYWTGTAQVVEVVDRNSSDRRSFGQKYRR